MPLFFLNRGSSYIGGGDPWMGAASGLMSYGLNRLMHPDGDPGDGDGKVRHPVLKEVADVFSRGTVIQGNSIGFVTESKTGKMLSIGGRHLFKGATFARRLYLARDMAITGKFWSITGDVLGGAGVAISIIDMGVNGPDADNTADLVIGVVSFVPGVGWVIGGVYFGVNEFVKYQTGVGVGTHLSKMDFSTAGTGIFWK
ncbi:MAG: hypothetical protein EOP52_03545 [Sphingobacteriales bacterium]|nr:MAG: hypothetical protein EOP52_03545 [Sphingobacteriales bacterium]